jgi:hypothetical protein
MQRKKRSNKKNKRIKGSYAKYFQQSPDRNRVVISKGIGVPDRIVQLYRYLEPAANRFNTAVPAGSISYNMNSMDVVFTGSGTQASIPYFSTGGISMSYERYRVIRSTIEVEFGSRETVNYQGVVVWPSTVQPNVNNSGDWGSVASAAGAKKFMLGPLSGGPNKHKIICTCDPQKLVGPEYLQQDEYAGTITQPTTLGINDPTTLIYWGVAFHNVNVNTVTTGGIVCQVTIMNLVELFEPRRDDSWS